MRHKPPSGIASGIHLVHLNDHINQSTESGLGASSMYGHSDQMCCPAALAASYNALAEDDAPL